MSDVTDIQSALAAGHAAIQRASNAVGSLANRLATLAASGVKAGGDTIEGLSHEMNRQAAALAHAARASSDAHGAAIQMLTEARTPAPAHGHIETVEEAKADQEAAREADEAPRN